MGFLKPEANSDGFDPMRLACAEAFDQALRPALVGSRWGGGLEGQDRDIQLSRC